MSDKAQALYRRSYEICTIHARRLRWAVEQLQGHLPFDEDGLELLTDTEIAVVDQLLARFAQLQDMMGSKLFPAVLELTKEQGELSAFIDKLNRLEKIGAIHSVESWLLLREVRNALTHEYPDDPVLQAETLNQVMALSESLLSILDDAHAFAMNYL